MDDIGKEKGSLYAVNLRIMPNLCQPLQ